MHVVPLCKASLGQAGYSDGVKRLLCAWDGYTQRASIAFQLHSVDDAAWRLLLICNKQTHSNVSGLRRSQYRLVGDAHLICKHTNTRALVHQWIQCHVPSSLWNTNRDIDVVTEVGQSSSQDCTGEEDTVSMGTRENSAFHPIERTHQLCEFIPACVHTREQPPWRLSCCVWREECTLLPPFVKAMFVSLHDDFDYTMISYKHMIRLT